MISCIIPSYKDASLNKTIKSILDNAVGEIEVVVVLDGYWCEVYADPRVRVLHLGKNRGMRGAINAGVAMARGDILMRTDEHCSFSKGFDKAVADHLKDDEIMTLTRYELDPIRWKRMDNPAVNFCKLVIGGQGDSRKFSARPWKERDEKMKDIMIAETEGMQGSCWFQKKSWWDKVIVDLQMEGYGNLIQDSHEMHFKTLKAGGRMVLNKHAWHAHRHRKFGRTHNHGAKENPANENAGFKYALEKWEDYYVKELRPRWDAQYEK